MTVPERDRIARALLLALVGALLAFAVTRRGHSVEAIDVRTYLEMTKGIAVNGLPYLDNGPVERFTALQAPWNVLHGGRYWGVYSPLYPYFAAPFLLLGGLRLMAVATYAITIPIALTTFALGRRILESERWAVVASAVTVASTPVLAKSLELTAYPLAVLLTALAVHVTLLATEARRPLGWSFLVGVLCALAAQTHLLCVPVGAAILGVLGVTDLTDQRAVRAPSFLGRTLLRTLWPTRRSLGCFAIALGGEIVFLLPSVALNRARFGTLNPFTYGPTPWPANRDVAEQTIGGHLRFAAPVLALLVVTTVVLVLSAAITGARARLSVRAVAIGITAVALVMHPLLRERGVALGRTAFAYIVDQSVPPLEYRRGPVGLGHLFGPWVTKATLQCTPIFLLAFARLFGEPLSTRKTQQVAAVALPCVALYAYLALRGNLPLTSALGFPWVYTRYTMPALPMLAVLAVLELRRLAPRMPAVVVAVVVAGIEIAWLADAPNDEAIARQYVLLLLPLVAGALTCVLATAARWHRALLPVAGAVAMATVGIGFGQSFGHELRANLEGKAYCDWYSDVLRKHAPERFAVFGRVGPLDPVLALRAERDVQYGDMNQVWSLEGMRGLIDHWLATGRPVYYVTDPQKVTSPWPDLEIRSVEDSGRIWRVVPRTAAGG